MKPDEETPLSAASSRRVLVGTALIACVATTLYACRDVTAPTTGLRAGSSTASLNGPGSVSVTPDSMHGWSFIDDQQNVPCSDPTGCRLVIGPTGQPLGNGSAELAATARTDGLALALGDYAGTPLSHVTSLSYSTYRQSVDSSHVLAIALQFNVDFDLSDASNAWQGRIVFEPYMTAGNTVPDSTWQSWNTLAGKWWGTRSTVTVNGVSTTNPCVQSSPCTWAELLQKFPNIGFHRTYGGIVLKAGSGWLGFRGNVDALTIGLDGANTTFSFDAPSTSYKLSTSVIGAASSVSWSPETTYSSGAQVAYAFTAKPGWETPVVILDDTLASPSGVITMTADRTLEVVADSIYTYEGLLPLERSIADLMRGLITGGDKFAAMQALCDFYLGALQNGTDESELAHARLIAEHVAIDLARDSANIAVTDAALSTHNFYTDIYPDGTTDSYDSGTPFFTEGVANRLPVSVSSVPMRRSSLIAVPNRGSSVSRTGIRSRAAIVHLPSGSATPFGQMRSPGVTRDLAEVAVPDVNTDATEIIFSNGILNSPGDAAYSKALLAIYVRAVPEFANNYTGVVLHYNRTHPVEMEQWDRDHPCVAEAEAVAIFTNATIGTSTPALVHYAECKGVRFNKSVETQDAFEFLRLRNEIKSGTPPSNTDVDSLVTLMRFYRERLLYHVTLVGHSEGTVIDAQAARTLAARAHTPLQFGDRCVSALALAPATPKSSYQLDDYHLKGLLARGDIATITTPGMSDSDWETFETPLYAKLQSYTANAYSAIMTRKEIHEVANSYLTKGTRQRVVNNLLDLRRECIPARAELTMPASSAPPGTTLRGTFKIWNQNGRRILGRHAVYGWSAGHVIGEEPLTHDVDQPDFIQATASWPDTVPHPIFGWVMEGLMAQEPVMVPALDLPVHAYSEGRSTWTVVAAVPGTQNPTYTPPPPAEDWDGSESACQRTYAVPADFGSVFYYKRVCFRNYKVDLTVPDTIPGGAQVGYVSVSWIPVSGDIDPPSPTTMAPPYEYACNGDKECLSAVIVELTDGGGRVLARSTSQSFGLPTVLSSRAVVPQMAPSLPKPTTSRNALP